MERNTYECQYCKKEYIPKRRRVQKYCSDSCRVSSHRLKNVNQIIKSTSEIQKIEEQGSNKIKVEKMSLAGAGNAAAAILTIELLKTILTKEENKPATKGDLRNVLSLIERYQEVKNLPNDVFGRKPFYDCVQKIIIYK